MEEIMSLLNRLVKKNKVEEVEQLSENENDVSEISGENGVPDKSPDELLRMEENAPEEQYNPHDELWAEYNARVEPLKEEKKVLEEERREFLFASRRELEQSAAQLALADGDIIRLKAEGKFDAATEKEKNKSQSEAHLQTLKEQQSLKLSELDNRISEIEARILKEAEIVKNIFVREFEEMARRLLVDYVIFVEDCWDVLSGFSMVTKCRFSRTMDRQRLAIHPGGSDANKLLYSHLREWVYPR
jgi:hypothetical protein